MGRRSVRHIGAIVLAFITLLVRADAARAQAAARACQPGDGLYVTSWPNASVGRLDTCTATWQFDVPHVFHPINVVGGPDGLLYVTTFAQNDVVRIDPATGMVVDTFASHPELVTAIGLTFGPDGHLYVSGRNSNSVVRFHGTTGAYIDTFIAPGYGGLNLPEALTFGLDGNLYVTEFGGNRVLRFTGASGAFMGVFATSDQLNGTRGLVFYQCGDADTLLVAGNYSNNVVRFDAYSGAFIDVLAGGVPGANGLAIGPDGVLYIAAEAANRILRFDPQTGQQLDYFADVLGPIGIWFKLGRAPCVASADLDRDGDVDMVDYAEFQLQMGGPRSP